MLGVRMGAEYGYFEGLIVGLVGERKKVEERWGICKRGRGFRPSQEYRQMCVSTWSNK